MHALKDKVAIVNGAGRGIGRGIALFFAREGAAVVVNDLGTALDGSGASPDGADRVVEEIVNAGGRAVANHDTVATMTGAERIVGTAIAAFGKLDVVVICHGIMRDGTLFNTTEEEWDTVLATHLNGTFALSKYAAKVFQDQRSGRIITFSAESGLFGISGQASHGAATSAVAGFTKAISRELEPFGVTANCVAPADPDPEDIAPFVAYLASDLTANVNGQTFLVDGTTISLVSQPRIVETRYKERDFWSLADLRVVMPDLLDQRLANSSAQRKPRETGRLLEGKVGIVTGAGRGIGRSVAIALAEQGARVVVNDLGGTVEGPSESSSAPADEVVAEIEAGGGVAIHNYESVATMEGGERIVRTAVDAFGRVDILVTPAGNLAENALIDMTEAEWGAVIAVHLKGTFTVAKYASEVMRDQRCGRIIPITSVAGLWGNRGQANYAAAKDGVAGFARSIARDLGSYGITVNCISPGADTRMTAAVAKSPESSRGPETGDEFLPTQLRRPPEAVAPVVAWLASDEAANVNGQIVHVAGGVLGLMSQPAVVRSMTKSGAPWSVEEIAAVFPTTLGVDLSPRLLVGGLAVPHRGASGHLGKGLALAPCRGRDSASATGCPSTSCKKRRGWPKCGVTTRFG